jgi:4-amino-4-deoxy-L-arabinose transferase-like glycosyltransferase
MNALDVFYWTLAVCVLVRLLRTDRPRLWLGFGAVAGVALLNKISTGFLGFGVVVGLLLSSRRSYFGQKWIWLGGVIALLLFLPHIIWQVVHGWPTAEFIDNATRHKIQHMLPATFLASQVLYTTNLQNLVAMSR